MRVRFAARVALAALATLLAALVFAPSSRAQQPSAPDVGLAAPKLLLDEVEAAASRENVTAPEFDDLRGKSLSAREDLRAKAAGIDTRRAAADAQLKALGPAPPKDGPPEAPAIAAERARLTALSGELGEAASLARQLATRADQLLKRIDERRRIEVGGQLFERSAGLVEVRFWLGAADAVRDGLRGIAALSQSWWEFARESGYGRIAAALATLAALAAVALAGGRWWRRRLAAPAAGDARFAKALAGFRALAEAAVPLPLATAAVIATLDAYALLPPPIRGIAIGLNIAVAVACFGRGVARGVLAPDQPGRRLPAIDDASARQVYGHLTWAVRALGAGVLLSVLHRQEVASPPATIATSALLALAVAVLFIHMLRRLRQVSLSGARARPAAPGLMAIGWIVAALILGALATGYIGIATSLALRLVVTIVAFLPVYLVLVFIDALFNEVLVADKPAGRAVAANLGMQPQTVELLGTLASAVLRLLVVAAALVGILAVLVAVGPRGLLAVEVFDMVQEALFGSGLAGITRWLGAGFAAAGLLLVGLLATRAVQRWLQGRFLPRTHLDLGLQHSISAMLGYVGFIAAAALALTELGIDLQKITLIAGALSVGIGFGLQSIVSNFVSGLILLAERPIRVGDSIVVKGEEGWVRHISVRATKIETYDRATVIIPNSDLITGVVKNWTHANTLGRIIVKVGVAYDSDPEQVRDLLTACARDHKQVVENPPPRAFLLGFGDNALEFELRCVVADVDISLGVKSDINFAVFKRLREAGIQIPFPQREVRVLGAEAAEAAAPAPAKPADA
jgi:small-conductance mechanosensitive channel